MERMVLNKKIFEKAIVINKNIKAELDNIMAEAIGCYGLCVRGLKDDINKIRSTDLLKSYDIQIHNVDNSVSEAKVGRGFRWEDCAGFIEKQTVMELMEMYPELKISVFLQVNDWCDYTIYIAYSESGYNTISEYEVVGDVWGHCDDNPYEDMSSIESYSFSYHRENYQTGYGENDKIDYTFPYKNKWEEYYFVHFSDNDEVNIEYDPKGLSDIVFSLWEDHNGNSLEKKEIIKNIKNASSKGHYVEGIILEYDSIISAILGLMYKISNNSNYALKINMDKIKGSVFEEFVSVINKLYTDSKSKEKDDIILYQPIIKMESYINTVKFWMSFVSSLKDNLGTKKMLYPYNTTFELFVNMGIEIYSELVNMYVDLEKAIDKYNQKKEKEKEKQKKSNKVPNIFMGEYPKTQDAAPEQIEWIAAKQDSDRVLLVSSRIIDSNAFDGRYNNTNVWGKCTLKKWLNNDFLDSFSAEELDRIIEVNVDGSKSKVFILSYEELNEFLTEDEIYDVEFTELAEENWNDRYEREGGWWTRTPSEQEDMCTFINAEGFDDIGSGTNHYLGVRPAMWVKKI